MSYYGGGDARVGKGGAGAEGHVIVNDAKFNKEDNSILSIPHLDLVQ